MQWLSRRQGAGRAVWMLPWVALLACGAAARTFENSSEGVFARDKNITEVAKLHAGAKRLMREMTTTDKNFLKLSRDIKDFSLSAPKFMWEITGNRGDKDYNQYHLDRRQSAYNFALMSWGPGFIFYSVIVPKWSGPNCIFTHYTRRFKSNYTQNQPAWMRDAFSCHTVYFNGKTKILMTHYPDVPCPKFLYGNYMCHVFGDHVAVQPWEKWADYALYVDVMYSCYYSERESAPYDWGYGRTYYPVRLHTCDPTRDCLSFPRKNWSSIGFDFSTTSTSTPTPTTKPESTTTLPPAIKTPPPIRRKSAKMVCPRHCKSRQIAEILWPIFFVTSLLVMFGVLPWIFMCAKNRTEREMMRRWYRASSQSGGTTFLLRCKAALGAHASFCCLWGFLTEALKCAVSTVLNIIIYLAMLTRMVMRLLVRRMGEFLRRSRNAGMYKI